RLAPAEKRKRPARLSCEEDGVEIGKLLILPRLVWRQLARKFIEESPRTRRRSPGKGIGGEKAGHRDLEIGFRHRALGPLLDHEECHVVAWKRLRIRVDAE